MNALVLLLLLGGEGDFWTRTLARSPEVERWLLEGDQRLQMRGEEHLREAEAAFAEAVRLAPRDPRARREHAGSLVELDRYAEALSEWRAVRALDQKLDAGQVASGIGVCLAHLGEHAAAAQEYRRALDAREGVSFAIVHWNLGDVEMALGHVDEALRQYQLAAAAAAGAAPDSALAQEAAVIDLALAVAYDRLEDDAKARAQARRAVSRNVLRVLATQSKIFFVPPEDRAYSVALAHEAAGERVSALEQWTEYLRAAPHGPWLARARGHLDALMSEPVRAGSAPSELGKCVVGRRVVADVRLQGTGVTPVIRIFPAELAPEVRPCLDTAARRIGGTAHYQLVGK
ncbi:MAG TPA: tetratricopeptide repeat protein [Polyangia bacterium]|nr:tetratricopeptide repeat protein [Polyangia bacterium]